MDLVSNYIGKLAKTQAGGSPDGIASSYDLSDNTFADMLQKQLNNPIDANATFQPGNIGIPSGLDICDFVTSGAQLDVNKSHSIKEIDLSSFERFNNSKEFTTSDVLAFYPSLFSNKPSLTQASTNGLFDFERKVAASSYGKYAKNIITDLNEFVTDTIKIKS